MKEAIVSVLAAAALFIAFPAPAQQVNNLTLRTAPPAAAATANKPLVIPLVVPDAANPGKTKVVTATVNNLAAFNPFTETVTQASVRKANAVAAAINAVLPGSATVSMVPSFVFVPGRGWLPIGPIQGMVTVKGVNALGTFAQGYRDPTGERGGGVGMVPGGGPPPMPAPSYKGSMGGGGSGDGASTGLDPTGAQSLDAFGFFTDDDSIIDIATIFPTSGEDDSQILTDLGLQFNSLFGPDGYSASYDGATDELTLNQPLSLSESLFTANTDTGLDLVPSLQPVPEPPSVLLLGIVLLSAAVLLGWRPPLWLRS